MSDDGSKRDDGSSSSVPPELKPFMGQRGWPEAERRDDAEVNAAFAPVEAMLAEWQREADKQDAKRGVGNVSEYVAPVPVAISEKSDEAMPGPKVAIAMVDVPRALPTGNPNLPTQEISTRALRRAHPSRTLGGNTEKMPVIAAAPSALGPQIAATHDDDAPGSVTPARSSNEGRGRMTGLLIVGALVLVAAGLGVRAATRTPAPSSSGVATASATAAPTVVPRATSAATSHVEAPAPALTASPTASVEAPSVATTHPIAPAPKHRKGTSDDPYDASMPPTPTVAPAPAPQPTAVPAPPPSQKPVAPPANSGSLVKGSPVY